MKKYIPAPGFKGRRQFFVFCFLLLAFMQSEAAERNWIQNADFEEADALIHWDVNSHKPTHTITVEQSKVQHGSRAIKIDTGDNANDIRLTQQVIVQPEKYYRLSGWIATENVGPDGVGGTLSLPDTTKVGKSITGTTNWEYQELYFKTARSQTIARIGVGLGAYGQANTGIVYIDNLELVEVSEAPKGSFEFSLPVYKSAPPVERRRQLSRTAKNLLGLLGLACGIYAFYCGLVIIKHKFRSVIHKEDILAFLFLKIKTGIHALNANLRQMLSAFPPRREKNHQKTSSDCEETTKQERYPV